MSPGFSDASLKLLEPKILTQISLFIEGLVANADATWSQSRDMATWCRSLLYPPYFMGD
jgi:hypothetical protein